MTNISKKRITVDVSPAVYTQLKLISEETGITMAGWIKFAIMSYLRRWKPAKDSQNWPKCGICGQKHDENSHFDQTLAQ